MGNKRLNQLRHDKRCSLVKLDLDSQYESSNSAVDTTAINTAAEAALGVDES